MLLAFSGRAVDERSAELSSGTSHELTDLARRFSQSGRHEEAAELLLLALRLDPKNLSVKLGLAEARKQQRQQTGGPARAACATCCARGSAATPSTPPTSSAWRTSTPRRGRTPAPSSAWRSPRPRSLANPSTHKLHGRLLFRRKDFDGAVDEFAQALRYNPFDREIAESLGRTEYERKQYEAALRRHGARLPAPERGGRGGGRAAAAAHPDPEADPRLGQPRASARSSTSARSSCTPPSTGWSGTASASWRRPGCQPGAICPSPRRPPRRGARRRRPARARRAPAAAEALGPLLRRADLPPDPGRRGGDPRRRQPDLRPPRPGARPLPPGEGRDHRPAHHHVRHLRRSARRAGRPLRRGRLRHRGTSAAPTRSPPAPARSCGSTPTPWSRSWRRPPGDGRPALLDALAQPGAQAARHQRAAQDLLLRRGRAGELPAPAQAGLRARRRRSRSRRTTRSASSASRGSRARS